MRSGLARGAEGWMEQNATLERDLESGATLDASSLSPDRGRT